jgi:hypothetical protein
MGIAEELTDSLITHGPVGPDHAAPVHVAQ